MSGYAGLEWAPDGLDQLAILGDKDPLPLGLQEAQDPGSVDTGVWGDRDPGGDVLAALLALSTILGNSWRQSLGPVPAIYVSTFAALSIVSRWCVTSALSAPI